jgi:hypothetical protein
MLIQHYKETIIEVFALIALTSAGSATLIFDGSDTTMSVAPQGLDLDLSVSSPEIPDQEMQTDAYKESDAELVGESRCRVYTAWCEAEVLLLNINSLKKGSHPSAPSPIP